jgi:hypothetical protein
MPKGNQKPKITEQQNTMTANRKQKTERPTMGHKTLHRKLKTATRFENLTGAHFYLQRRNNELFTYPGSGVSSGE